MSKLAPGAGEPRVELFWLPLGAGGRVVRPCGRLFERLAAARAHRRPADLYHCALQVRSAGARYVVEQAPAWGAPRPDRGVVVEGPVGLAALGRWRWFRYEVRRWRDGMIPDLAEAVGGARQVATDASRTQRLLELVPTIPTLTWGRDEAGAGEMWNSNSVVSWLLTRSGHDPDSVGLPPGGRAPGWAAGVLLARRQPAGSTSSSVRRRSRPARPRRVV